jgi:hypothetical protein
MFFTAALMNLRHSKVCLNMRMVRFTRAVINHVGSFLVNVSGQWKNIHRKTLIIRVIIDVSILCAIQNTGRRRPLYKASRVY